MNGFGFIEYEDAMDARDVVPGKLRISMNYITLANIFRSLSYDLPSPLPLS